MCFITVAAPHFHKKQTGFVMPSPLQFLCHPAAAAPLNGFAERCQLPGLLNPGYSFICCSLSGPLWNKEQHIQSSQSVQTGILLWRLPLQGVRKWHLLWHYSLVRTGAATVVQHYPGEEHVALASHTRMVHLAPSQAAFILC